jgi:hypothetical protein
MSAGYYSIYNGCYMPEDPPEATCSHCQKLESECDDYLSNYWAEGDKDGLTCLECAVLHGYVYCDSCEHYTDAACEFCQSEVAA